MNIMNRDHTLSTKQKPFWTPLMFTTSKNSCSFIPNLYLCLENCLCIFPPSPNFHFTLTCYVIYTLLSLLISHSCVWFHTYLSVIFLSCVSYHMFIGIVPLVLYRRPWEVRYAKLAKYIWLKVIYPINI